MLCNPRIWLSIQTQPARRPWAHHHHQAAGRFPLPTTEEWGEGKGEGIPISRANSMEGAPLPVNSEEHRTSNAEHRMAARVLAHFGVRCSMLDFRCFHRFRGFNARNISGKSLQAK